MHERSISPHPGFRFWAHRSMVEQGVQDVEACVRKAAEGEEVLPYDPVYITLNAQCEALWRCKVEGTG